MSVLDVNPEKHERPRDYRRALWLAIAGVAVGIAMTILGLYVLQFRLEGYLMWVGAFVLVGPSVIFLSAVAFATYLENIERRYGEVYEDEGSIANPPPARPNP